MKGFLLDTNVVSELRKPRPNRHVVDFVSGQPMDRLFLSVVTLAEIRFGIEKVRDPLRRAEIEAWLDHSLRPLFEDRVLPVNEDVLLLWRLIIEAGRKRGHTFSHPDVLIAASAEHFGLSVVTRNVSEFIAAGVPVIDPWKGES